MVTWNIQIPISLFTRKAGKKIIVFTAIATHISKNNSAFPSIKRLEYLTNIKAWKIKEMIKILEAEEYIKTFKETQGYTFYSLIPQKEYICFNGFFIREFLHAFDWISLAIYMYLEYTNPTLEEIARYCGLLESKVIKKIQELINFKVIIKKKTATRNIYKVINSFSAINSESKSFFEKEYFSLNTVK